MMAFKLSLKDKLYLFIILLLLVLIFVGFFFHKKSLRSSTLAYDNLSTEFITVKKRNGVYESYVPAITTLYTKQFLQMKSKDSTILRLQETVKENAKRIKKGGNVSVISSNTSINISTTNVIENPDALGRPTYLGTVSKDGTFKGNPIIWVKADVYASRDSISANIAIEDRYDFVFGWEKEALFKRAVPYTFITTYNPYNVVTEFKSYNVKTKTYNWSFGVGIYYGVNNVGFTPIIGFGIQRTLWKF